MIAGLIAVAFYPFYHSLKRWIKIPREITGSIVGASHKVGHLLRSQTSYIPTRKIKVPVVIVGGGMAGLCAAWKLKKSGSQDFLLLELEPELGGNSRSGKSPITPYPWGAHYVPLPDKSMKDVCELFKDLGVIVGVDLHGEPIFNERYLCFAPQERLFLHGRWQDDLFPAIGASSKDIHQFHQFRSRMLAFKELRGQDGKRAFAIPIEDSSADPEIRQLDSISMESYLNEQGWDSPRLRWYIDYACRDDFGLLSKDTSAWAGIHYWASRPTAFTKRDNMVLTWPEGNGWIVEKLKGQVAPQCRTNALVVRVDQKGGKAIVDFLDTQTREVTRVEADRAILACPQFVAGHLVSQWQRRAPRHLKDFTYAPWVVANLWVSGVPEGVGAPLAWDNVIYNSDSLGYVVATHQNLLSREPTETIWTYYYPLAKGDPAEQRAMMLGSTWEDWKTRILKDLSRAHPQIEEHVRHIDVMFWGHGMVRPTPGFIWGTARQQATQPFGAIQFAHSDLSGISIFEEALYHGFRSAERVLASSYAHANS